MLTPLYIGGVVGRIEDGCAVYFSEVSSGGLAVNRCNEAQAGMRAQGSRLVRGHKWA